MPTLILTNFPNLKCAKKIAQILLEEKLVACVNLLPKITSFYVWEKKLCEEQEVLGLFKTQKKQIKKIEERLSQLHPYEVPEIISIQSSSCNKVYQDWIKKMTQ